MPEIIYIDDCYSLYWTYIYLLIFLHTHTKKIPSYICIWQNYDFIFNPYDSKPFNLLFLLVLTPVCYHSCRLIGWGAGRSIEWVTEVDSDACAHFDRTERTIQVDVVLNVVNNLLDIT